MIGVNTLMSDIRVNIGIVSIIKDKTASCSKQTEQRLYISPITKQAF